MRGFFKKILPVILSSALLISFTTKISTHVSAATTSAKNFVVYYPNWATYNSARASMSVDDIPWSKVTVINHAFFTVGSDYTIQSLDTFADFQKTGTGFSHGAGWSDQNGNGCFGEYKYYKGLYPNVKVLVSIGGWTRGENFHTMASTASNRQTFINSIISFLKQYPFIDGIDIDWEYPGINRVKDPNDQYDHGCPGGPEDKQNYTALLKEIRAAYNANGLTNKMLTIAAPGGYDKVDNTEPDKYAQYLDMINVMTYDMHGAWDATTNNQSALYADPNDPSPTSPIDVKNKYNTDYIMKYFRDTYHVPASKLNVGSPYYSRGWKNVAANTGSNGLFAAASGAPVGNIDDPQNPGGQNTFAQMETLEKTSGWVKYRDNNAGGVPYLYNASQGIMYSYEDTTSAAVRCDYVNNNGFGGIIAWDISDDDPNGMPLTTTISNKLAIGSGDSVVTVPGVPTGLTASSVSTSQINVSWNTISGATSYDLLVDGKTITNVSNPYAHTGLAAGSTHTYQVRAVNSAGASAWSSSISAKTNSTSNIQPWAPNTAYKVGDLVSYNGITYRCQQPHTSLVGWEPPVVPALWQKI